MTFLFFRNLLFFCCFIISCTAPKKIKNLGVVISKSDFHNPKLNKFIGDQTYAPDMKIWYKDGFAIENVTYLYSTQNNDDPEIRKAVLDHYTFIDIRTKSFYDYTSFSDTAKLIKKYIQPDSADVSGAWSFFRYYDIPTTHVPIPISDTTIEGIIYKRLKLIDILNHNGKMSHLTIVAYFRCDIKGTMFQYDRHLGEKIGCPNVRLDDYISDRPATSSYIEFVADKLTPEELKVFAAWEKNAKRNPIK